MTSRNLYITETDKRRLEELIEVAGEFAGHARKDLEALAKELAKAEFVDPRAIPTDVVTMNSRVILRDVDTGEKMNFILVFPTDADMDNGAISVLAPIGTAILGYSEGDIVEWPVPSGVRRIQIEQIIYQPEAAGRYDL
jgi:regulator of nucleoside diphosphate kinase